LTPFALSSNATQIQSARRETPAPLWLLIGIALALGLVMSRSILLDVWQKGAFFDSDDAMRAVQVRALLHGQHWFDLTAYRLDPPAGVFMHWSRLVDLPIAVLIKLFSLVLPADLAERASRIAFPLILQGLLYYGMARIAKALIGPAAIIPILVLTLLSGMEVSQFQPGRIHHTAPQIMLSIFMIASFVEALDPGKARRAAMAGALAALSIAIGLETLPFVLLLAALAAILWIWRGQEVQRTLGFFALGLGIMLPLAYVATIGPSRWFVTVCDAYSPVTFVPGMVGALVLGSLAIASRKFATHMGRIAAASLGGALVLAAVLAIKPVCYIDPYHGIDPLVREIWLNNVVEGFSLRRLFAQDPGTAMMMILPIALGTVASVTACVRAKDDARARWLVVTLMSLAAAALSVWMVRVTSFAVLVASFGGAWCIVSLREKLVATKWREIAALSFCLALPFSTVGWALAIPSKPDHTDWKEKTGCLASSAFVPLQKLPPGLIAGPIDAGSHLLAFTPHSVLAAPYHRNNDGNRTMIDAMLASPDDAHAILVAHHVTYVMTCAGLTETEALAHRAPHGLAAALKSNHIPPWLHSLQNDMPSFQNNGPYHVFVVQY
jgi:hypothetical protein